MTETSFLRKSGKFRLLMSTALIGMLPFALLSEPAFAIGYLDNVDDGITSGVNPGNGTWSANSPIWSDGLGLLHRSLATGETGVLRADTVNGPSAITLTISGRVRPGRLDVQAGSFTLTGGIIGEDNREWALEVADGLTLAVSSSLEGELTVDGAGTVQFSGNGSELQSVTVDDDATLGISGTTAGQMTADGTVNLTGTHNGQVEVNDTGSLTGNGTINGSLENDGTSAFAGSVGTFTNNADFTSAGDLSAATLINTDDGRFTLAAGHKLTSRDGQIRNDGEMELAGTVEMIGSENLTKRLRTTAGSTLALRDAVIGGNVENATDARLEAFGVTGITGRLVTGGDLVAVGAAPVQVNIDGNFVMSGGRILQDGTGRLTISATLLEFRDDVVFDNAAAVLTGPIINRAQFIVSTAMTLTDEFINAQFGSGSAPSFMQVKAEVDANDNMIRNRGVMSVEADPAGNGSLNNLSVLTNTGAMTTEAGTSIGATSVELYADSTLTHAGSITGNVSAFADSSLTLNGGTITGNVVNNGDLQGRGAISGTLTNNSAGDVTISGATSTGGLENAGTVVIASAGKLTNAGSVTNRGEITTNGDLELTGADATLTNAADAKLTLGGGAVTASIVNAEDGEISVTENTSVTGSVTNNGTIKMLQSFRTVVLTVVDGTFTNTARIESVGQGRFRIVADQIILGAQSVVSGPVTFIGEILNAGDLIFTDDTTLTGGLLNQPDGVSLVMADVDADGHNVRNEGSMTIRSQPRGTLTDIGTLSNSGDFTVEEGAEAAAGTISNEAGGEFLVQGTLSGVLANAATGIVRLDGGRINGAVSNLGTLTGTGRINGALDNDAVATIAGNVGAVDNSGTLTTAGNLTVASLTNSNKVTVVAGHQLTSGSAVRNDAQMDVRGRVQGSVNNALDASLSLDGGTISGAVNNKGGMTARGTVGGALTNDGTLSSSGNLSVGSLTNAGNATVNAGHVLTADNGVTNTGNTRLNGTLRGDLNNNAGGTTTLGSASRIEGAVENNGTLTGRTTITGSVTNRGQATLGGSTGDLTNGSTGTLRAQGTLEVGRLTNTGAVVVAGSQRLTARDGMTNSGTVDLRGTLQASGSGITNREGATIALDGATVIGNTVNEGLLDVRSDSSFTGDLTNRGTIDSTGDAPDVLVSVRDGTFRNSGTVQVSGDGFLTIQADDIILDETSNVDNSRVSLIGSLANEGNLVFRRDADLTGDLVNAPTGRVTVSAAVDAKGNDVGNSGTMRVGTPSGSLTNIGNLTNSGGFTVGTEGAVSADAAVNRDGGRMVIGGTLTADSIRNETGGTLTSTGTLAGSLTNAGTAVLSGSARAISNTGTIRAGGDLRAGAIVTDGTMTVAEGHVVTTGRAITNNGTLRVDGRVTSGVQSSGQLIGSGRIGGNVVNSGRMTWTGDIARDLNNTSRADLAGSIGGDLRNTAELATTGDLDVAGRVVNEVEGDRPANLSVASGTVLAAKGGVLNGAGAVLRNNGAITGNISNLGNYTQTGTMTGSLTTRGSADLSGRVTGDVRYRAGNLRLADGMVIGGTLSLGQDFNLNAGSRLTAARTVNTSDATLTLGGRLTSDFENAGTVAVSGSNARIDGTLESTGTVDMTGDRSTAGRLYTSGLSGNGEYKLDMNLGDMTADTIVVRGGAATGHYKLTLNNLSAATVGEIGRSVTIIDVDEAQGAANNFTFDPVNISVGSERIVYDLQRQSRVGDLAVVSITNPAIGALAGNVSLTQTLIDSVVNRPTSPFVTGLAYDDAEKPCGPGAWGRVTGGTAKSSGEFATNGQKIRSNVDASYYGMQVGSDLACFDERYAGWNLAFGVLGGVNHGDSSQPVSITLQDVSRRTSVNNTDFTQVYGGVYMAATKDRWQADLQVRGERTDFTVSNRSLVGGVGLGLTDADFTSTTQTVSGSVSYVVPVGKSDWTVVPTAGFAWSRTKTDDLRFDVIEEGITETLEFEDAERTIGFVGATVARSYVQAQRNSALQVFATGTVYHDFADPSVSVFTREGDNLMAPQRIESENLGTYGELSIGANFIKVLSEQARGRQFSTSARIDARFGESLDSVGVTGQVRWQF